MTAGEALRLLAPCPRCEGTKIRIVHDDPKRGDGYYANCFDMTCGHEGNLCLSLEIMVDLWNNRTPRTKDIEKLTEEPVHSIECPRCGERVTRLCDVPDHWKCFDIAGD